MVLEQAPPFGAFLQSFEWGEFQRQLGRRVERIDVASEDGRTIAQAIEMPLPLGQAYWYVPKGPLGKASIERRVEAVRSVLPDGMFLRIEPRDDSSLLKVRDAQPANTLLLDLTQGEDAVLAQMKAKTRYNIRLAGRKGVISQIVALDRFEDFVRLMKQTTQRDAFYGHPELYYKTMIELLQGSDVKAFLAMAFYEDRPLAGNIMIDFGGVRTYLHGASSNLHRNVMAPYALHWFLIQDAIKKGIKAFDFWGIAPEDAEDDHPWKGITRYKKGFGGEVIAMPGTFDLPMNHLWYSVYRSARRLRRLRG